MSATLRLALLPAVGWSLWELLLYDVLVVALTMFHHADISLGRFDRWLRWLLVTPDMHKVHHSDVQREADTNFATILACWDHLAGTFCMRGNLRGIQFGVRDLADEHWQTVAGMLETPLARTAQTRAAVGRAERPLASGSHLPSNSFTTCATSAGSACATK